MELLILLVFAATGAALMKRNGLSWVEGALWGGILTFVGLIIIFFRIKSNKRRLERPSNPQPATESRVSEETNSVPYAPQSSPIEGDLNSQISSLLKQKTTTQLLFGLAWWTASAVAMYFALASTDSSILWFGGALGALFHWYRVYKLVEVGRIQRVKFLDQRVYTLMAVVLLIVAGSVSKIVPEYFRIDVPTVGTCWAKAELELYSPVACWSDKATLRTVSLTQTESGCGLNGFFRPDTSEDLFTCLEEIKE